MPNLEVAAGTIRQWNQDVPFVTGVDAAEPEWIALHGDFAGDVGADVRPRLMLARRVDRELYVAVGNAERSVLIQAYGQRAAVLAYRDIRHCWFFENALDAKRRR